MSPLSPVPPPADAAAVVDVREYAACYTALFNLANAAGLETIEAAIEDTGSSEGRELLVELRRYVEMAQRAAPNPQSRVEAWIRGDSWFAIACWAAVGCVFWVTLILLISKL